MFISFRRLSLQFVSVDEVVHALVSDVLAPCEDERLQVETHAYFDHEGVVDFLAGVEGKIKVGQFFLRVGEHPSDVFSLDVGQTGKP